MSAAETSVPLATDKAGWLLEFMEQLQFVTAILYYLVRDWTVGFLRMAGIPLRPVGNRMHKICVDSAVGHHEGVWTVYRYYHRGLKPVHVCEVGPGDSLGMGVLFVSDGAESVTFVDRFNIRPPQSEKEVWEALFRRHAPNLITRFDSAAAVHGAIEVVDGVCAEQYFAGVPARFDFICSNAVLEHLDAPLLTLTLMYNALAPGGVMVHIVDLKNHGLFEGFGPHVWLETPAWLHRKFRHHTAKPNRVLLSAYKQWAQDRSGVEFFVRQLAEIDRDYGGAREADLPPEDLARACERIAARRCRFAWPHFDEPTADLAVSAFFLVVTKPASTA